MNFQKNRIPNLGLNSGGFGKKRKNIFSTPVAEKEKKQNDENVQKKQKKQKLDKSQVKKDKGQMDKKQISILNFVSNNKNDKQNILTSEDESKDIVNHSSSDNEINAEKEKPTIELIPVSREYHYRMNNDSHVIKVNLNDKEEDLLKIINKSMKPDLPGTETEFEGALWSTKYMLGNLKDEYKGNREAANIAIQWLKDHKNLAPNIKKAIMLVGPPGCGKSTLAHRLAELFDYGYREYSAETENLSTGGGGGNRHNFGGESSSENISVSSSFVTETVIPAMLTSLDYPCIFHIEAADTIGSEATYKAFYTQTKSKFSNILQISKETVSDKEVIKTLPNGKRYIENISSIQHYPHPLVFTANSINKNIKNLSQHCLIIKMNAISETNIAERLEQICEKEYLVPTPLKDWLGEVTSLYEKHQMISSNSLGQFSNKTHNEIRQLHNQQFLHEKNKILIEKNRNLQKNISNEINVSNEKVSNEKDNIQNENDNVQNEKIQEKKRMVVLTMNQNLEKLKEQEKQRMMIYYDTKIYDIYAKYRSSEQNKEANICHLIAYVCEGDMRKAINTLEICSYFYKRDEKIFPKKDVLEIIFEWNLHDNFGGNFASDHFTSIMTNRDMKNFDTLQEKIKKSHGYLPHVLHTHCYHFLEHNTKKWNFKERKFDPPSEETNWKNLTLASEINDLWSLSDVVEKEIRQKSNFDVFYWKEIYGQVLPIMHLKQANHYTSKDPFVPVFMKKVNQMFDETFAFIYNNANFGTPKLRLDRPILDSPLDHVKDAYKQDLSLKPDFDETIQRANIFFHFFVSENSGWSNTVWNNLENIISYNKSVISGKYYFPIIENIFTNIKLIISRNFDLIEKLDCTLFFQFDDKILKEYNKKELKLKTFYTKQIEDQIFSFSSQDSKDDNGANNLNNISPNIPKNVKFSTNINEIFKTNKFFKQVSIYDSSQKSNSSMPNKSSNKIKILPTKQKYDAFMQLIQKTKKDIEQSLASKDEIFLSENLILDLKCVLEKLNLILNVDKTSQSQRFIFQPWISAKCQLIETLYKFQFNFDEQFYIYKNENVAFQTCLKKILEFKNARNKDMKSKLYNSVLPKPHLKSSKKKFSINEDNEKNEKILDYFINLDFQKSLFVLTYILRGYDVAFFKSLIRFAYIQDVPNPITAIHTDSDVPNITKTKSLAFTTHHSFLDRLILFQKILNQMNYSLGTTSIVPLSDKQLAQFSLQRIFSQRDNDTKLLQSPFKKSHSFQNKDDQEEHQQPTKKFKKTKHGSNNLYRKSTSNYSESSEIFNSPTSAISEDQRNIQSGKNLKRKKPVVFD